jgi:hypothetical protein
LSSRGKTNGFKVSKNFSPSSFPFGEKTIIDMEKGNAAKRRVDAITTEHQRMLDGTHISTEIEILAFLKEPGAKDSLE